MKAIELSGRHLESEDLSKDSWKCLTSPDLRIVIDPSTREAAKTMSLSQTDLVLRDGRWELGMTFLVENERNQVLKAFRIF